VTEPRQLPHKAWAYVVFGLGMLLRLWAWPFTVLGWVVGIIVQMFALGWDLVFDDPILDWAVRLSDAHRRKDAPPKSQPQPWADGIDDEEFDDD
jgi:hypothetical protein